MLRGYDGTEHPTLTFMHPDTRLEGEKAQSKISDEIQRREEDILDSFDDRLGKVCLLSVLLMMIHQELQNYCFF